MKKTNKTIKKILSIALCLALVMSYVPAVSLNVSAADGDTCTSTTDCTGTYTNGFCVVCGGYETPVKSGGYYQIDNAGKLFWFAAKVNGGETTGKARLTADIKVNENLLDSLTFDEEGNVTNGDSFLSWTPIGWRNGGWPYFKGTIDGANYTISGIYGNTSERYQMGLVGYLLGGTVKNLTVVDSYFCTSHEYGSVGGIAATHQGGVISNCAFIGTVVTTCSGGGISGASQLSSSEINNCYSDAKLYGNSAVLDLGGIVGGTNNIVLNNCYYLTGNVERGHSANADEAGKVEGKSKEQFLNGEVAYLLQGEQETHVWGQLIDTDTYPVLGGEKVYSGYASCANDATAVYTNTEISSEKPHSYINGICTAVESEMHYQPAVLNESGIYEISNAGQLYWFAQLVNNGETSANAILMADIDMTGIEWTPICSTALYYSSDYSDGAYPDAGYAGTFNGDGYVIKNLSVIGSTTEDVSFGLFGTVSGTVKNLGMDNFTYTGAGKDTRVGSIVGQLIGGKVENCYAVGSDINTQVNTTNGVAGGIAGCNYGGTVATCYVYNLTMAAGRSGGVVGDNRADTEGDRVGTMTNCYTNYGNFVGTYTGTQTNCGVKLNKQFACGEVAFLLGSPWSQGANGLPVLRGGNTVYENTCGSDIFYSTTDGDFDSHNINTETLLCTNCGNYEPATLVTAENYGSLGLDASYDGYYVIQNASNLYWYSEQERIGNISGSIVLLDDITLDNSRAEWIPIGWDGDYIFDGRGNTITLKLNYGTEQDSASYGLFGTCNYSVIKNLFLDGDITVNTTGNVGAIAASMYRTTISGVISTANVTNTCTTGGNAGGLVGYFGGQHNSTQYSKIENCAVYANVTGYNAGGLVGQGWNGNQYFDITNVAYVGNVTTTDTANGAAGAIVGYQATDGYTSTFTNIYWCEDDGLNFYGKRDTANQVYTNTSTKTPDQFASGEVAYLLQQGNTEQVWGQDNNQTDAKPMFTSNELYKVVTVGETGNYSVANVGDTNADGTVDVIDYQTLVNKALADDHEQIETASYDDIVKYDLDGDGYLDVLDASLMHLFINGFTTVDVYAVGDYDLNGKAFEEADIKAIKHAIENPEKLATYKKYASDINGDGKLDENDLTALTAKCGEVTGTECADNVKVYYRWGNKYSTCTATAMCTLCSKKVAVETVNTTSETLSELTCTQDGEIKYTATFQNELLGTKSIEIVSKAEGHKYNDDGECSCGMIQLNIADISKTVYFNDNDNKLDLSTLFTLPDGAGNVTYELVSGSGNLEGSTLNIVLQGTEKIKVTVAETETCSADEFEITVKVEAPKGSGSFDGEWVTIGF